MSSRNRRIGSWVLGWLLLGSQPFFATPAEPVGYYQVTAARVIDGDTVDLTVALGFRLQWSGPVRLYGIDTPEVHGVTREAGLKAKARLQERVDQAVAASELVLLAYKQDKYGRQLGVLYVGDLDLNALLITEGLAIPYFGGTKQ